MLQPDPEEHLSARECLESGCVGGVFRKIDDGDYALARAGDGGDARIPTPPRRRETETPFPPLRWWTTQPMIKLAPAQEAATPQLPPPFDDNSAAMQAAFLFWLENPLGFRTPLIINCHPHS